MSLNDTVEIKNKTENIDEELIILGLKDNNKAASKKKNKTVRIVEDKSTKKVIRLSIEVPVKTHIKFSTLCKIDDTSMQSKALELITNWMKNQIIEWDE